MQAIASNLMISFYHLLYHCTSFTALVWTKEQDVLVLCKGRFRFNCRESTHLVSLGDFFGKSAPQLLRRYAQLLDQVQGGDYGALSGFSSSQLNFAIELLGKLPLGFFCAIEVDHLPKVVERIEDGSSRNSTSSGGDSSSGDSSSSGQPEAAGA